jgi:hypothetical protein
VNHGPKAAVETVFAARRRAIEREFGICTQNPSNSENLAFRCALKGDYVGVITFEFGEFVFGYGLFAGKKGVTQKGYEEN